MRYRWIAVALGLSLLANCSGNTPGRPVSPTPETARPSSITGKYEYLPNPCTTEPCLPGMVYAVVADDTSYFLTVDGRFFVENRPWDGYTPAPGDQVIVTGWPASEKDVSGKPFQTFEVLTLKQAR